MSGNIGCSITLGREVGKSETEPKRGFPHTEPVLIPVLGSHSGAELVRLRGLFHDPRTSLADSPHAACTLLKCSEKSFFNLRCGLRSS